jgi:hypothetical protein
MFGALSTAMYVIMNPVDFCSAPVLDPTESHALRRPMRADASRLNPTLPGADLLSPFDAVHSNLLVHHNFDSSRSVMLVLETRTRAGMKNQLYQRALRTGAAG